MPDFLLVLHSLVRWLILIAALAAVIRFLAGWRRAARFDRLDNGLAAVFSGMMDLQVALGLIYMFWTGFAGAGFAPYRIQHAITMIFAAIAAHLPSRWKKEIDTIRYRNSLFAVLGAIVIIIVGLAPLSQR
ncbi:MAG: hypothetical protein HYZ49_08090 [Chloroflexi bacterium]|nr:hypothetical protein [Chloroflexota bacterium]